MNFEDPTQVRELRLKINQESAAVIRSFTLPLLARESPTVREATVWGTGILLEVADEHFLVTAAHVADLSGKQGMALHLPGSRLDLPLVPLTDLKYFSTKSKDHEHRDDDFDIAVSCLSEAIVRELNPPIGFLRLNETDPSDPAIEGLPMYMAFGFPTTWAFRQGGRLNTKAIALEAFRYKGERGAPEVFKADRHVAIDYHKSDPRTWDGLNMEFPDPHGLSGGGVWRVVDPGSNPDQWTTGGVKLVGIIQYADFAREVLIATQIEFVIGMIRAHFPKLRTAVDLHVNSSWQRAGWRARVL